MAGKAVISLSTGLEDSEKVTVAFLVAVGDGPDEAVRRRGRPLLLATQVVSRLSRAVQRRPAVVCGPHLPW